MTVTVKAVVAKHQKNVTKFVKFNAVYDNLVNQDLDCTAKATNAYDKAYEAFQELPVRERNNIKKAGIDITGY